MVDKHQSLLLPSASVTRRGFLAGTAGAGLIVSGAGALAGCSAGGGGGEQFDPTAFSFGPPQGGTPRPGGTLTVAVVTSGAAETLSIFSGFNTPDFVRIYSLYDLLFFIGEGGEVKPGLVEVATPNADATEWTFELRRGVTWHDGKAFDADDVVYTIKNSWGNPENAYNAVLSDIVDFANVRKLDNYTVRVPLKLGVAQFPSVTCIVHLVVVQDGTTDFANGLGTGPFKLDSFEAGKRSSFSANKDYWGGAPHIDTLVVDSSFTAEQPRLNALIAGQVDIVPNANPVLAAASAKAGEIVLGNQPGPGFIGFPQRVDQGGALGDARVRKALKLIPDRQQYVDAVFNGYAVAGNDCPGHTNQYFAEDLKRERDPDEARSLLKAAGYPDLNLELATADVVPGMVESATLFKEHAAAAGVGIKLKQSAPADYFTLAGGLFTRSFGTLYFTTGINSLAAYYLNSLVAGAGYSESHWGEPGAPAFGENNSLLFDALAEVDAARAKDKWHQVQTQMFEEGPLILPVSNNWLDAYSKRVRGVKTTTALNCDNFNFSGAWLES
jgi:peptide/nickel transport system substrate-binding protein